MNDTWHKNAYERVLLGAETTGPAWEDLSEDQKANIRVINLEHQKFMDQLGQAISTGGPLPLMPGFKDSQDV